jgi:hypothetical protein
VVLIIAFFVAAGAVSAVLLTGRPVVATDPGLAVAAGPASADGVAGGPVAGAVQAQDR